MRQFGLIGYPLSHSFSGSYFAKKFETEKITDAKYDLFPLKSIDELPGLLSKQPNLKGLNVTIPYKQEVKQYLSDLDDSAQKVGAVNVIKITKNQLIGYNSDYYGFKSSLLNWTGRSFANTVKALILGSGGAAKAVIAVFKDLEIPYLMISRDHDKGDLTYQDLNKSTLQEHKLIINTTPLGMAPNTNKQPSIPYHLLGPDHYLYDLIYNPEETLFLKSGKNSGTEVKNGLEMLYLQAEKSWEIWNS